MLCLIVFYLTKTVSAYALGFLPLKPLLQKETWYKILPLLLGLIAYVLLAGLPYIGWVIGILAIAFGLGATWLVYRHEREQQ